MLGLPRWLAGCIAGGCLVGSIAPPAFSKPPSPPASTVSAPGAPREAQPRAVDPASSIIAALPQGPLRALIDEILEANPTLARQRHRAAAAAARAPQLRALPDPILALDLFALPPETRTGPQRLRLSLQQKVPTYGKLELAEKAALLDAAAAELEVRAHRLELVAEARRLANELAFLDTREAILHAERLSLERFENAAQARYAAGTGLQQESVRIQAQITRVDTTRLELQDRRASLLASLNRLRDRPATAPVEGTRLISTGESAAAQSTAAQSTAAELRWRAPKRPEVAAAEARIEAARVRTQLANRQFRPDLTLGLAYTVVEGRRDLAGRLNRPEDNGDDILSLRAAVNLPVRRSALEAGVTEAQSLVWAAEEHKRGLLADIESRVGELAARIPLLRRQQELLENVLQTQAREALRSAEAAYTTGKLNAVDLLDAEVVLFDVQTAAARTQADLNIAKARLESELAAPLSSLRPSTATSPEKTPSETRSGEDDR